MKLQAFSTFALMATQGSATLLRGTERGLQLLTPENVWQLSSATKEYLDPTTANGCVILKALGSTTGCTYVEGTTSLSYPAWFDGVSEITIGTPSAADGATGITIPANCDFIMAGQHMFVGLSCLSPGLNGWQVTSTFHNGVYASENQIGVFTSQPAAISPSTLPYKLGYVDGCAESKKPTVLDPVTVGSTMRTDVCGFDSITWDFPTYPVSILGNKIQGQTYEIVSLPATTCETPGDVLTLYVGSHFATFDVPDASGALSSQTAWSRTKPPTAGNWGAYSSVTFTCATKPSGFPPVIEEGNYVCETIFAKATNSQCFLDLGLQINRWGWTTLVQSAPVSVPLKFDLWAGAAHCDTENGRNAGSVEIRPDGSVAYILADGVIMTEYHVNVGSKPVLTTTRGKKTSYSVAPGKYTFTGSSYSDSSDLSDIFNSPWSGETVLSGVSIGQYPSYLIFHGVACSKQWE